MFGCDVVSRGWLGVGIQDLTPELREYYGVEGERGVLVSQVNEGQPADLGGIQAGDIITEVDGQEVSSSRELSRRIAAMNAGSEAKISLLRKGKPHTLTVKLGNRADDEAREDSPGPRQSGESGPLGMTLSNVTPDIARRFGLEEGITGVVSRAWGALVDGCTHTTNRRETMNNLRDRIELWLEVLREQKENKQDTQFIKGKLHGAADALWLVGLDLSVNYVEYTYTLRERD